MPTYFTFPTIYNPTQLPHKTMPSNQGQGTAITRACAARYYELDMINKYA